MIITEQDIIKTYDQKQQEQCRLYYQYKKIKQENPSFGYKRISKLIGHPYGKTRWWHTKKQIPVPIQTIIYLKEKGLIPLTEDNCKLPLIIKVLGTTFGDGGIFKNLNAIFLSSSELDSVEEFGKDIKQIFGNEIEFNSRIIEGGEYGHSWCYQNTNRSVTRLFQALGAHIGRKSVSKMIIPKWIIQNEMFSDFFFSSLFGNEIGIPKIHKDNNRTDSLDFGLVCDKKFYKNRRRFLNYIQNYLKNKNVKADKIYSMQHKEDKKKLLIRLAINLNFDNLMNFYKNINLSYSNKKTEKLTKTIKELQKVKLRRFNKLSTTTNKLTKRNYSEEWIKHNLRLTDKSLSFILNQKPVEQWN